MKRLLLPGALLIISLISCKKDNNNQTKRLSTIKKDVLGKWYESSYYADYFDASGKRIYHYDGTPVDVYYASQFNFQSDNGITLFSENPIPHPTTDFIYDITTTNADSLIISIKVDKTPFIHFKIDAINTNQLVISQTFAAIVTTRDSATNQVIQSKTAHSVSFYTRNPYPKPSGL